MFKAAFVLGALEQSFSGGFLKRLETVLLDLVCLSFFMSSRQTDDDQIRQKPHSIITING